MGIGSRTHDSDFKHVDSDHNYPAALNTTLINGFFYFNNEMRCVQRSGDYSTSYSRCCIGLVLYVSLFDL